MCVGEIGRMGKTLRHLFVSLKCIDTQEGVIFLTRVSHDPDFKTPEGGHTFFFSPIRAARRVIKVMQ